MKQTFMQRWFGGTLIAEQLAGVSRLMAWLFGLIAVLLLVSGIATTVTSRQTESLAAYGLELRAFNASLLQLRRNEKDFLDRRTAAELDKHAANARLAREQVARLIASGVANATDLQVLQEQQKNLDRYTGAFKTAADAQVALGLDENAGLQGTLRKAVRSAEEDLTKAGTLELTASMLQLRRHEKDFLLRERDEYVQQHLAEQQRFKSLLGAARLDGGLRSEVQRDIEEYGQSFQKFVAGTLAVNKAVDTARKAAQDTEAPIAGLLQNAVDQRQATGQRAFYINVALALLAVGALVSGGLALRQSLSSLRTTAGSIQSGVAALQGAVDRVRAGEELKEGDGVQTQDEIGAVWRTVHGLLTERREAQLKAESENEQLNNSVISILQSVHALSQRDLTARAPVTQDIIGTVSDSINALTDETSKVLRGVSQIAGQVASASGKVQSQAALVSRTAEDERTNVGQMIESLANATQTMNQVSALAEQSNVSAAQATQATDTALETVNGTVRGMESIRETIAETEKRIKRLGERSQEISGIVNLINTISERTHVLALNASMQAAVAGEAGRGFAVVAEEVQRLAESSRNATQQIGTLVSNIQLETNETISTVNRTIGQVVHGSEQAQKAGEQMRLTQEITSQLVALVKRIGDASTLQKEMSADLLQAVQRIGASTERTAEQIFAQNQETDSLQASARRLVESVNVFKLPQMA